ncbi:MAG TPA: CopG family transcriptional regulator [Chloroflexota bacterium]|jgi:hypothetical protein|nr:CopG family transcriptional regulator [Chloroflexota bacterium]
MIRKQIYLAEDQDRKVKRLAAQRRCTEAEVIRDAVDQVPDPDGDDREKLRAAGLLVDTSNFDAPEGAELEAMKARLEKYFSSRDTPIGLSKAVLDEREESPW